MDQTRVFASKTDAWFVGVSTLNAVIALFLAWSAATDGYAWTDIPFCGGLLVFGVIVPAWMFASTRYTLRSDELVVRCGPMRTGVPLADITSAVAARGLAPAPALSNDRVRIDYRAKAGALKSVSISPRDRESFLAQLSRQRTLVCENQAP